MKNAEEIKKIRETLSIGLIEAKSLFEELDDVDAAIEYWRENKRKAELAEQNKKYQDRIGWFFDPKYCEGLTEEDRAKIKLLRPNYCLKIWSRFVTEKHRHLMLVNSDEDLKYADLKSLNYNWGEDWDLNNDNGLKDGLSDHVNWADDDKVFFLYGRYAGYETTWAVFLRYWLSFFYEDEKNILINPKDETVVIFTVHGQVEVGTRNSTT